MFQMGKMYPLRRPAKDKPRPVAKLRVRMAECCAGLGLCLGLLDGSLWQQAALAMDSVAGSYMESRASK